MQRANCRQTAAPTAVLHVIGMKVLPSLIVEKRPTRGRKLVSRPTRSGAAVKHCAIQVAPTRSPAFSTPEIASFPLLAFIFRSAKRR